MSTLPKKNQSVAVIGQNCIDLKCRYIKTCSVKKHIVLIKMPVFFFFTGMSNNKV